MNERDWDSVAGAWDEHIMSSLEENTNGTIASTIAAVAASHRSILDYGCGVGRYLPLLSASFESVTGVDYSARCVEQARVLTRALPNVALHTVRQFAGQPRARFEVVLLANVLLHAKPAVRAAILDLALARLKPGGTLLLLLPAVESVHLSEAVRRSHIRRRGSAYSRPQLPGAFDPGVIAINGQPTKHYSAEEIPLLLQGRRLRLDSLARAEYSWDSESFDGLDRRLEARPWDWLVRATR